MVTANMAAVRGVLRAVVECLHLIMSDDGLAESESDPEDEIDDILLPAVASTLSKPDVQGIKANDFVETTVPAFLDDAFQSHFRLRRSTVEELIGVMGKFVPTYKVGRPKLSMEKVVLASIWTLGNQESYRGVADRFGMGKGHLHHIVDFFCENLSSLISDYISWPRGYDVMKSVKKFDDLCEEANSFPGVVGCVDSTHIKVNKPRVPDFDSYCNRKGYFSIILQGVCDADKKFIDISFGWPGSCNDARVWKNSPIRNLLKNDEHYKLPHDLHILGDSAYPVASYLMVLFKDNGALLREQKLFNKKLDVKRIVVENAFVDLKNRCRRLNHLNVWTPQAAKWMIGASCVLHNLAIMHNDYLPCEEQQLVDEAVNQDTDEEMLAANKDGAAKRAALAARLFAGQ